MISVFLSVASAILEELLTSDSSVATLLIFELFFFFDVTVALVVLYEKISLILSI